MRDRRRNPEGYLDLTAYRALEGAPKSGEVWKYERKGGGIVEELIIRNHGDYCACLLVIDDCMPNCIPVKARPGNDINRYVNPQMLHFIYTAKLKLFLKRVPDENFVKIVEKLKYTLDFDGLVGDLRG